MEVPGTATKRPDESKMPPPMPARAEPVVLKPAAEEPEAEPGYGHGV